MIFLGHFQPFHNGHVDAFAQICALDIPIRHVFIAVASSEISNVRDNPFSFGLFIVHSLFIAMFMSFCYSIIMYYIDSREKCNDKGISE